MNVRFVGNGPIVVGHKAIYPQETLEIGLGSLETLRHQYGQDAFVELSAPEQPVVDVEPSPVIAVDADAFSICHPAMDGRSRTKPHLRRYHPREGNSL